MLCTPYGPDAPFSPGNAMGRNKLIYAQSLVTLVVASDRETGGTWSGAVEALKDGSAGWRCGGAPGKGRGTQPSRTGGRPRCESVDELEALLHESEPEPPPRVPAATQPSLFESPA